MTTALTGTERDADRVRQIFRFLAAAEESRMRPVRTTDGARDVVRCADLPDDPRVGGLLAGTEADIDGSPAWLVVHRPPVTNPPTPPRDLAPRVATDQLRDFASERAPRLLDPPDPPDATRRAGDIDPRGDHDGAPDPDPDPARGREREHERIEQRYAAWAELWLRWAADRRAVDPLVRLYDRLHRMHEDAADAGESHELVLGLGRLLWQSTDGSRVERHLLVHRAILRLDPATGTLAAMPDPTSPGLLLEEGMLDACQHVRGTAREEIREALALADDATAPEHLEHVHAALRGWVNSAHGAGRYEEGHDFLTTHDRTVPVVGLSPALILHERPRRSTLEALETIARQVGNGAEPTDPLRFIASGELPSGHPAGRRTTFGAGDPDTPRGPGDPDTHRDEVYFALPSNEEQRSIAERLRANPMVVVQGPPGTGKTHTIANLITDLLAHGERVLITSHTTRALRVLRDKLPESVRDLCVSRTEDGAGAQRELEASVHALLERASGHDPRASRHGIDTLTGRLARARATRDRLLADLAELRELETRVLPADLGDYRGTLQDIAERLAEEKPRHTWIGAVPERPPVLRAEQALRLLHARRALGPGRRTPTAEAPDPAQLPAPGELPDPTQLPAPGELPGPGAFEEAVATILTAERAHARARGASRALDDAVDRLDDAARCRLVTALDDLAGARGAAEARIAADDPGAGRALKEVLTGRDWETRTRHDTVTAALRAVTELAEGVGDSVVTGLDAYDTATALARATALHDGLRAGGKLTGLFGRDSKLARSLGGFPHRVRVDGRPVEDAERAARVLARVNLEHRLARAEREQERASLPWGDPGPRIAHLRQVAETLTPVIAVADARVAVIAAAAASPELVAADWHDRDVERAVRALLRARVALRDAEEPRRLIAAATALLRTRTDHPDAPPALRRARRAVTDRDIDGYRAACAELADLREATRLRTAYIEALGPVREALPRLADRITETPDDPVWDERLPELDTALAWSAWRTRLERLTDPGRERALRVALTEADDEIRLTLGRLAAARAWHHCLEAMSTEQSRALRSYQQAVHRIRGRYRHRYRQDAQQALRDAQSAVPAWIMPLHQVVETVPMDRPGLFDVVIVDEASQSGPEAMLLTWLARRVVVVGDGKQVSPSNVGLRHEEHFRFRDRLLGGLPAGIRSLFGPDTSFFDLAETLAAGRGTLMLREHFRCMPEIIGFSNELCYGGQLLPMRQYGSDRLPPVRTVHVAEGMVGGTNTRLVNLPEVEALIDALVACCADPAYADRTMGVISLRSGIEHLTELENRLTARLPYEERERRRIRVGNAEDFQGDERDIVFISCVNAPLRENGPVPGGYSGRTYEQRINVAASRARDQVWVFHSAPVERFHENDLRRRYLDHLTSPPEEEVGAVDGEVLPNVRHEAFDNLFQQRVYLELVGRGYRVRPRYRVGRHCLDLVVEGGTRRLAVVCDGDTFAEGGDAATEAARRRELERLRWRFVGIRGSRFHWDRERALAPLWEELRNLGIRPRPLSSAPAALRAPVPRPASPLTGIGAGSPPRARAGGHPAGGFPVTTLGSEGHHRVLRELRELRALLDRSGETAEGDHRDPRDHRAIALRDRRDPAARYERRVALLLAFLDAVRVDPEAGDPDVVAPGTVFRLEFEDAAPGEGGLLHTVAETAGAGLRPIPPASPLGQALMWRAFGDRVTWTTDDGRTRHAVIRPTGH
ncbi:AAA domain-containing protein [Streptomyces sp. ST2-7A]|uniref:AAA domain-containing protein n=1 Tax=Streptomyces sp. ST2-7A TaxID=2907214 RepID=UPI001F32C209|nr:AAA domain-containing protein [Streptomyces sp. ST2-7A]MCE7082621.1 AAA domain-containing protein [Streptomyces sp. ST2-7A]